MLLALVLAASGCVYVAETFSDSKRVHRAAELFDGGDDYEQPFADDDYGWWHDSDR